jgi:hypothetical protein
MKSHEIKLGSGPCQITPTLARMDAAQAQASLGHVQNCPDCIAEIERLNSTKNSGGVGGVLKDIFNPKDILLGTVAAAALGVFLSCRAVTKRMFVDSNSARERNPMLKEQNDG